MHTKSENQVCYFRSLFSSPCFPSSTPLPLFSTNQPSLIPDQKSMTSHDIRRIVLSSNPIQLDCYHQFDHRIIKPDLVGLQTFQFLFFSFRLRLPPSHSFSYLSLYPHTAEAHDLRNNKAGDETLLKEIAAKFIRNVKMLKAFHATGGQPEVCV